MVEYNKDLTITDAYFVDSGQGDVDFYTHWYSVCYIIGMLNSYRDRSFNIGQTQDSLELFLKSRGIYFNRNSSFDLLEYIYDHWVDEINKRGTKEIARRDDQSIEIGESGYVDTGIVVDDIYNNIGIGVTGANIYCPIVAPNITLSSDHSMSFDLILQGIDDSSPIVVDCKVFSGDSDSNYIGLVSDGVITSGKVSLTISLVKNSTTILSKEIEVTPTTKIRIEILTTRGASYLYIDSELEYTAQHPLVSIPYIIQNLFYGDLPILANAVAIDYDFDFNKKGDYRWAFNEGAGISITSNLGYYYSGNVVGTVTGLTPTANCGCLWRYEPQMNNTKYSGIWGELRRMVEYGYGEFIYELISQSELGLVIDQSSFLSEEANMVNVNKAYQKGEIVHLGKFPLNFYEEKMFYIEDGWLVKLTEAGNTLYWGINTELISNPDWKTNAAYKPAGLIPFIPIPVANGVEDDIDGYEISFLINYNDPIDIKFMIYGYDRNLDYLADSFLDYTTDSVSNEFLVDTNFTLGQGVDLWVRAVFTPNQGSLVHDNLNIGVGSNLYGALSNGVSNIVPVLVFKSADSTEVTIKIKDFVVRPLSVNTSKGLISSKGNIFCWLKNNSGELQETIIENASDISPFDCSVNIQFL